jgi:hypothetical protein
MGKVSDHVMYQLINVSLPSNQCTRHWCVAGESVISAANAAVWNIVLYIY